MPELIPIAGATRIACPAEDRFQTVIGPAWRAITPPGRALTAGVVGHPAIGERE
jgi:hypothetical protein